MLYLRLYSIVKCEAHSSKKVLDHLNIKTIIFGKKIIAPMITERIVPTRTAAAEKSAAQSKMKIHSVEFI